MKLDSELAKEHYLEHYGKDFFDGLIALITSGLVFGMAWEDENVVAVSRKMIGATKPLESLQGTIRGDLTCLGSENIIHGSDSIESSKRELALYFSDDELL